MSRLATLPTLAESQAIPHAIGKYDLPSKLDRAIRKKAARLADRRALDAWALAVKTRDQWKDRKTGVRVYRTRDLDPLRAEAHHLEPKSNAATRTDVRNGICLSMATHDAVERGRLRIDGTVFFRIGGQKFIDATFPVIFVRT